MNLEPKAKEKWDSIPPEYQLKILNNIWCPSCMKVTSIKDVTGDMIGKNVVLRGFCNICNHKVARVLEGSD